jgi:hypothetical protein
MRITLIVGLLLAGVMTMGEAQQAPTLKSAALEIDTNSDGIPDDWGRYISGGTARTAVDPEVRHSGKGSLRIEIDAASRCTISQTVLVSEPGVYTFGCWLKTSLPQSASATLYVQWLDDKGERVRIEPSTAPLTGAVDWTDVAMAMTRPEGASRALVIVVVTAGAGASGKAWMDDAYVKAGSFPRGPAGAQMPAVSTTTAATTQISKPVPPVYTHVKNLYLQTPLVREGRPQVTIVAPSVYRPEATTLQSAIEKITGVRVPVVSDQAREAAVPFRGHLILLGNRSTNRTMSALYDLAYLYTDLKYPGPDGYEVRSLHNPFGNGYNAIIVGGSDADGVRLATTALTGRLGAAGGGRGQLAMSWLMDVKLGKGYVLPSEVKDYPIWEASRMYGSSGYFGWNIISKHMAAYYMTGSEKDLREFLRLSFPDAAAIKQLEDQDGERIENKTDPLAGPYHYAAHMMITLWDLIEESPLLTDEDRLKVTNAFSRQLAHRVPEGVYDRQEPPSSTGDRHGDWAAFSLYALGRYFQKDYPDLIWQRCLAAGDLYFSTLHRTYWMASYNDHLFWFTSYYDPILNYILFSGDRTSLQNGILRKAYRTQEILSTGLENDWGLTASSLSMLNKAAYLFGDGRWLYYREHARQDENTFRLGQSFWPGTELSAAAPSDVPGKWTIQDMPEPMWKARGTGLPLEQSFKWGSYRSEMGPGGDYILLDGYNGGGRNPYHTFDILELRLNGTTLLKGYANQVLSSADGMVEPQVAMDSALLYRDVLGETVTSVSEVPKAAFCNWRRSLVQRVGRYALIVDDLGFRTDSDNIKLETTWQMAGASWNAADNALRARTASSALPPGWLNFRALDNPNLTCGPGKLTDLISRLSTLDIALLKAQAPGTWLEMPFTLGEKASGDAYVDLLSFEDRGIVRLELDGRTVGQDIDLYAGAVATTRVALGRQELASGEHRLRVEVVGKRAESRGHMVGLIGMKIRPQGAPASAPDVFHELHPSDPMTATVGGGIATLEWRGTSRQGQHRLFLSLLAPNATGSGQAITCARLADNAAALALPEAALAVAGQYRGCDGDMVVLSGTHLYGHALTQAGIDRPILTASAPVEVDWDLSGGMLQIVSKQEVTLALALASGSTIVLDGEPVRTGLGQAGLVTCHVPAGRHAVRGAVVIKESLVGLGAGLESLLGEGRQKLQAALALQSRPERPTAPAVASVVTGTVGGKPTEAIVIPSASGQLLAVAQGKSVVLLDAGGKEVRRLQTEGEVRTLRWWDEFRLLLVGCADEKVVACDESGARKWEFTSIMDREVYEAGKQYWFKSAHPGIYGLYSGTFDNGKSRAFVGSACTLEILDERGQLVKRLPVFWGPGRRFLLLDAPDGSRNLLVARWHNDGMNMAIVNSKTLTRTGSGFDGVPAGHTYVTGWDCMNREDNFVADLDGDGKPEVVSAINGSWNRVTVYRNDGTPLYNAQFGPGTNNPRDNLRQMDLADLNGDGKPEIVVGIAAGLVVVLDGQARRIWARRLPSPPTVLAAVGSPKPQVLVGCQDGTVALLDGAGNLIGLSQVQGRPALLRVLTGPMGQLGMIVTDSGEVTGFALGR